MADHASQIYSFSGAGELYSFTGAATAEEYCLADDCTDGDGEIYSLGGGSPEFDLAGEAASEIYCLGGESPEYDCSEDVETLGIRSGSCPLDLYLASFSFGRRIPPGSEFSRSMPEEAADGEIHASDWGNDESYVSRRSSVCDVTEIDEIHGGGEEQDWEEIDARLDDRDVVTVFVDGEHLGSVEHVGGDFEGFSTRNIDWEVLPSVGDVEQEEDVYTSEYEVLFGLSDRDGFGRGSPPAAKSVVEGLPSVLLTEVDAAEGNAICAVCKDEMPAEEPARRLPCSHHYHGECILHWLSIRNTCPVCRYELPTDDPEYESRRSAAAAGAAVPEEELLQEGRYGFELLPQVQDIQVLL